MVNFHDIDNPAGISSYNKSSSKESAGTLSNGRTTALLSAFLYLCIAVIYLSLCADRIFAEQYYVSGTGSDNENDGLDTAHAFRTISTAAALTNPGDSVYIMNGTYMNESDWDLVNLSRSGQDGAWIVYIAYPGHKPLLSINGWCGFKSRSASYIEINGLEIVGNRDNITLDYANANKGIAATSGGGIEFDGRDQQDHPHHIRILNNTIRKCCGGGISMIQCDYVTIDNNIIEGNAWYSQWANSGISTYQNWRYDESTDYKMIVTRNICHNNRSLVNWIATGALSDGNGIIIDDSKSTQNGSTLGAYAGRTLVANNICFNNGGSGIHSYESEHVDIVNNTVYFNAQVVDYPSCYAGSSSDVNIFNNIIYAAAGKKINDNYDNTNVAYDYNIYFGGISPAISGEHDRVIDPQLVNVSTDPQAADFRPSTGSSAIDQGMVFAAVSVDIAGIARPQENGYDIGAYEIQSGTANTLSNMMRITKAQHPDGMYFLHLRTIAGKYPELVADARGRLAGAGTNRIAYASGMYFIISPF